MAILAVLAMAASMSSINPLMASNIRTVKSSVLGFAIIHDVGKSDTTTRTILAVSSAFGFSQSEAVRRDKR